MLHGRITPAEGDIHYAWHLTHGILEYFQFTEIRSGIDLCPGEGRGEHGEGEENDGKLRINIGCDGETGSK